VKIQEQERGSIEASVLGPDSEGYIINPQPDVELFIDLLRCMLVLDPTKRETCRELLNHEWFRSNSILINGESP
jgi:serine/threonine protein kinase